MEKKYVFLYTKGVYVLGFIDDDGKFFAKDIKNMYPVIFKDDIITEDFLNKMGNVGYFSNENQFMIYDKDHYECIELDVPVYVRKYGELHYIGKKEKIEIPIKETIKCARALQKEIIEKKIQYKLLSDIKKINSLFTSNEGIVCVSMFDYLDIYAAIEYTDKEILWSNGKYAIIANPNNIVSLELDLFIPEEIKGFVIGKKAKNISLMEKKIKVNRINLKVIGQEE